MGTRRLKKSLERRQAAEPVIGHMESDGRLGRNWLKGTEGDQMNVLLCCAGHNMRLILNRLGLFRACVRGLLRSLAGGSGRGERAPWRPGWPMLPGSPGTVMPAA